MAQAGGTTRRMVPAEVHQPRKFALMRLEAGDYLLPSNDKKKMWRISRYEDEGQIVWWLSAFLGSADQAIRIAQTDPERFLSWDSWEYWAGPFSTRAEAVREAEVSAKPRADR